MKAHLQSLSTTKERIKSRIQNSKPQTDRKSPTKSPGDEFEESTADLTSNATLSYQFPPTAQSPVRPKVQGPSEPSERSDCYQSVVSDLTWQDQEVASSSRRQSSFSSSPYTLRPPTASTSTHPYHQYSGDESPRLGNAQKKTVQNYGNYSTTNSKPHVTRPQHTGRQHSQHKRASMSSVVSDLTWNGPMPQEASLLDESAESSYQLLSLNSPQPQKPSVLGTLGNREDESGAHYAAFNMREKEPERHQSYDESVSSLVSDITWMDLENSTIGRASIPNATHLSPHASTPDSRSGSPARSSDNNIESDTKALRQKARASSSFQDSTVSELTWMNSESSLKISDLMRSSIMEVVNEGSGTPSSSDGSKELNDAVGIPSEEAQASPESKMKPKEEAGSQQTRKEKRMEEMLRREADAMPRIPRRHNSSSSFDMLVVSDGSEDMDEPNEASEPPSGLKPKKVSKAKKGKEPKAGDEALARESEHSVDSVSKKKGTKTKAGNKPKTKKSKKKSKKLHESQHSAGSALDTKPKKKKGKKKKPSERPKLDGSEHVSPFDFDGTLKKPVKKGRKQRLDDSERTNDSEGTLKTKITRKRAEKKREDSDRSLLGGSDRSNFSSTSTFDGDKLPELKEIVVLKKRDDLDTSGHSVQSAFELGSTGKSRGKRSSRSRKSSLDSSNHSASNHSVQSCLEMATTTFSSPRPSALTSKPLRPSFRPKVSTKKSKRKSVTFADGEPSRPLVAMAKKEMTRDWGEASLDRRPSMSQRDIASQSPPRLPPRRVSQGMTEINEKMTVAEPKTVYQSPSSDGVNFLLDRLSTSVHNSESEALSNNDVAPRMPRSKRITQDSPDFLSPTTVTKGFVPPSTPVLSTPKISARDQLGLKRVASASRLITPTGRILGKQRSEKRRTESSMRKGEVFESMTSLLIDESPDEE